MKRVTGIGGIFFQAKDPVALRAWYQVHLGIDVQEWGVPHSPGLMVLETPPGEPPCGLSALQAEAPSHRAHRRS